MQIDKLKFQITKTKRSKIVHFCFLQINSKNIKLRNKNMRNEKYIIAEQTNFTAEHQHQTTYNINMVIL